MSSKLQQGSCDDSPPIGSDGEGRIDQPYEKPAILKAVQLLRPGRRQFVVGSLAACGCAKAAIMTEGGVCTCHAVCTCDVDDESHSNASTRKVETNGTVCTCNTVCDCNSVCSCDTVGGGGGGTYSYSYYY